MIDVMVAFTMLEGRRFMVKYNQISSIYEEENGGCYLNYVNSAGARTGVEIKQDYDAVHKIMGDAYHFLKGDE